MRKFLDSFSPPHFRLLSLCIIILAILGFYGPSLMGGFVYDDEAQIVDNPYIKSFVYLPKVITSCIWEISLPACKNYTLYYRPLHSLSYIFTYAVSSEPWIFHLVNLAYYAIFCYLLLLLLSALLKNRLAVYVVLFLFLLHPIHSEVVIWIGAVPELLLGIFALLMFLAHISHYRYKDWLTAVFYFLALLSKETAIVLPVFLLLYDYFAKKEKINWVYIKQLWRFGAIFAIYLVMRLYAVGLPAKRIGGQELHFLERFYGIVYAFGEYIKKTIYPHDFNLHIPFEPLTSVLDGRLWPAAILCLAFLIFFTYGLRTRKNIIVIGLSIFVLFLLPPLIPMFLGGEYLIAERYLFLPSLGFAIVFGAYIAQFLGSKNKTKQLAAWFFLCAIFALYAKAAYAQNIFWRSSKVLYEHVHLQNVKRGYPVDSVYFNLALIAEEEGDIDKARKIYEEIISNTKDIQAREEGAYNNLGNIYYEEGKVDEAIELFKKAIEINKKHRFAFHNLAVALLDKGMYADAIQHDIKALGVDLGYKAPLEHLRKIYSEVVALPFYSNKDSGKKFHDAISEIFKNTTWQKWEYNRIEEAKNRVFGTPFLSLISYPKMVSEGNYIRARFSAHPLVKDVLSSKMILYTKNGEIKTFADGFKTSRFGSDSNEISLLLPVSKNEAQNNEIMIYFVLNDFRYYKFPVSLE